MEEENSQWQATLMFEENVGAGIYDLARRELFFLPVLHLSSQLLIVTVTL